MYIQILKNMSKEGGNDRVIIKVAIRRCSTN